LPRTCHALFFLSLAILYSSISPLRARSFGEMLDSVSSPS
jgi:hypothetical protein